MVHSLMAEIASMEADTNAGYSNNGFIRNNPVSDWSCFKNGDLEALERIYIDYFDMLCLYGRQFSAEDPCLVQDCIQDLFIQLYTKRSRLSDTNSIKFYLMKSLRRLIIYKKTINMHKNISIEIDTVTIPPVELYNVENKILKEEEEETHRTMIQKYILLLPKRQRDAIYLRYYTSLKYDEIAEKMNLTTKSVYKIIYKGLKSLKIMYEKRNLELFTIEIISCLSYFSNFATAR